MKRIGTFKVCDIYDEDIEEKSLYIENGELGFRLRCTVCSPDCDGHFTKLNNLEFLGYKLVEGSVKVQGNI